MKIITVSREFGSGGRELGKRLSDVLGWDYYDKEIINRLAEDNGLDENYVRHSLNNHEWHSIPLTYSNTFASATLSPSANTQLLLKQRKVIESIAEAGHDCIIVGRDADVILSEYKPLRVFVCADMESRVARCMKHEEKKESGKLSEKDVRKNIKKIDRRRIQLREMVTGHSWGDPSIFDLTVNAGGKDIKKLSAMVAEFAKAWFDTET